MAQSRLEKIGTIFTRVNGLLRSGAMKPEDKPIWYELYEAFPPKLEPRFDRPTPKNIPIRNIFYEEDLARAKFHKSLKQQETINLFDRKRQTRTQEFLKIYQNLKSQGALHEEKVFETSIEILQEQRQEMKSHSKDNLDSDETFDDRKVTLTEAFNKAKEANDEPPSPHSSIKSAHKNQNSSKNTIGGIDIKNLFKD